MKRFIRAVLRCLFVLVLPSRFVLQLSSCYRQDVDLSIDYHNDEKQ